MTIGGSLQAHQRRQDVRPRQPLHDRRQHRPQPDRLPAATASSATSIRISSSAPTRPITGNRADHPHRRLYRLCAGQPQRQEHLLRPLRLDTFDITSRLSLTAGGRYNLAQITTMDDLGTSPDLNGYYTFQRFNPVVGLTYKIAPEMTVLRRLFGGEPRADAARARLLQSGAAVPARGLPGLRSAAAASGRAHLGGRAARRVDDQRRPVRLEGRACSAPTAKTTSSASPARFQGRGVFQNVQAHAPPGPRSGAKYRHREWLVYANYAHDRCDLSVHRRACVAEQSVAR